MALLPGGAAFLPWGAALLGAALLPWGAALLGAALLPWGAALVRDLSAGPAAPDLYL